MKEKYRGDESGKWVWMFRSCWLGNASRFRWKVPQEIACTRLRPDIVSWSVGQWFVDFIELTAPWEDSETKKPMKQKSLDTQTRGQKLSSDDGKLVFVQWKWDVGVSWINISLLEELGVRGQSLRKTVKETSDEAARWWIWIRRNNVSWGTK